MLMIEGEPAHVQQALNSDPKRPKAVADRAKS
jgi:hypothetical protein